MDSTWGWKPGHLHHSPSSENNFPCNLGHLSFPFCKTRTIIHAGCVLGTAGPLSLPGSPSSQAWLERACLRRRRAKSVVKFKVYKEMSYPHESKHLLWLEENKVSHCSRVAWLKARAPPAPLPVHTSPCPSFSRCPRGAIISVAQKKQFGVVRLT